MSRISKFSICIVGVMLSGCAVAPKPLTSLQMQEVASAFKAEMTASTQSISGGLDLHSALARAIKYNQDIRVEQARITLNIGDAQLQSANMLPNLVANSEYYSRSKPYLSSSSSSHSFSSSSDIDAITKSIGLSWNILDFGLSYVRATQAADKVLIQVEQRRRVVARIVEETRVAYWRAVSLERLVTEMEALKRDVNRALSNAQAEFRNPNVEPLPALNYERDLLSIERELDTLRGSLAGAREQLKQLINAPQDEPLRLKETRPGLNPPLMKINLEESVYAALTNRPEVRQLVYDMRINRQEAKAALLEALPGISLSNAANADSNSYLRNPNWVSWGTKASWNLINVFRLPLKIQNVEAQEAVNVERGKALAVAISAQVYIARGRYAHHLGIYKNASRSGLVQKNILQQTRVATRVGRLGEQLLVRERMATVLANARQDMAFADLQNSYATLVSAIGLDDLDYGRLQNASVEEIAGFLRQADRETRTSSTKLAQANTAPSRNAK